MIATVDYHHLYYKDYWLAPSKANLNGYTLEISPAPMYYVYMAFLLAEIMTTIGIIISSYCSQRSMPNKGKNPFPYDRSDAFTNAPVVSAHFKNSKRR